MSRINKYFAALIPRGFLWRLTFLNSLVIVTATAISGWAMYNTACFLAAGVGDFDAQSQQQFNSTLLNYLWIFMIAAALLGSLLHFYLIKRLIKPIRSLIQSTEQMKIGRYPEPVEDYKKDEIGQLVVQYNGLIAQLKTNEQLREKIVSDLSHELRTPLSNLTGYLQGLKDGDIIGEKELYASLYEESNRLSQMIEQLDQLKDWDYLSTQTIVEKETYEIERLLNQCVEMFDRPWMEKNTPIQLDIESCEVCIHVEGIQQVISNLLDNAIRYYNGTGPILLTGKNEVDHYCISVTGPSALIPANEREKIFSRFYRIEASRSRSTGGSGLGLAISKEIVERHHQGEIGIHTTSDRNTFWIKLPKE